MPQDLHRRPEGKARHDSLANGVRRGRAGRVQGDGRTAAGRRPGDSKGARRPAPGKDGLSRLHRARVRKAPRPRPGEAPDGPVAAMTIPLEKEDDVEMPFERCCFCRKPTPWWTKLPRRTPGAQVACCQACSQERKHKDVPTKDEWCDKEERLMRVVRLKPPPREHARFIPLGDAYPDISKMKRAKLEALTMELWGFAESGVPCTQLFMCSRCRTIGSEGYVCNGCGVDPTIHEDDL